MSVTEGPRFSCRWFQRADVRLAATVGFVASLVVLALAVSLGVWAASDDELETGFGDGFVEMVLVFCVVFVAHTCVAPITMRLRLSKAGFDRARLTGGVLAAMCVITTQSSTILTMGDLDIAPFVVSYCVTMVSICVTARLLVTSARPSRRVALCLVPVVLTLLPLVVGWLSLS